MAPLIPDDHDPEEDASYAEFKFTYYAEGNPEGDEPKVILGQIESHIHNAPGPALVDSLLTAARAIVADQLTENMFSEHVPEEVRKEAALMLATNWLVSRLKSDSMTELKPIEFSIPDDLSGFSG